MINVNYLPLCRLIITVGILAGLLPCKTHAVSTSAAETQVANTLGCTFIWTSVGEAQSCHRDAIVLDGVSAAASVDNQTGMLIKYNTKDFQSTQTGPPALTMSDAQSRASSFIQRVGISLDGNWLQVPPTYFDHGSGWRDYTFSWQKVVQGVRFPASIDVAIDADSGQVRSYMLIDDTVTISLVPGITANNAAIAVAVNQNITNPVVQSAFLRVWYQPVYFDYTLGQPGVQTLCWEMTIQDPDAAPGSTSIVVARVDANTGSIETILATPAILHHSVLLKTTHNNKKAKNSKGSVKKSVIRVIIIKPYPKINLQALKTAKVPPTVFQLANMKKRVP